MIVKAHSAHPGTSELVGRAVQAAIRERNLPAGTLSLLFDSSRDVSQGLIADHRMKAIGFTGSRAAGTAIMKIAADRAEPILVYAEMSSINPVVIFPHALEARGSEIGKALIPALTLGAGQFCTNPGLVLTVDGPGYSVFVEAAKGALTEASAADRPPPRVRFDC